MSLRLVPKSMTLNDLERRNGPYFAFISPNSVVSGEHCVKVVEGVVVKSSRSLSHLLMSFLTFLASDRTLGRQGVQSNLYQFFVHVAYVRGWLVSI